MLGDAATEYCTNTSFDFSGAGDLAAAQRHLEGGNFAFADGHVKWLRPEKVLTGWYHSSSTCGAGTGASSPTGSNATFCIS
jgi:prepilin-type processing-associated H-X9-DG protein